MKSTFYMTKEEVAQMVRFEIWKKTGYKYEAPNIEIMTSDNEPLNGINITVDMGEITYGK